ncbi:MAG: GTPase [Armatimonadota bacterium]
MPANLTPQYLDAEEEFKRARTPEEKLAGLEKMLALIPKHKGTDKLVADIRKKIKKIKEQEEKKKASAPKRVSLFNVKTEGAASVALIGFPNTGKSSFVSLVTNAKSQVGEYPFTTTVPVPGMMDYEDIQIQLIDLPPVSEEYTEPELMNVLRKVDLVLFVVDVSHDNMLDQMDFIINKLRSAKIEIENINVNPQTHWAYIKTIVAANKSDLPGSPDNISILKEFYGDKFTIHPVSFKESRNIEELKKHIFEKLEIIRVYSKPPGREADMTKPYVLEKGSSVLDAATMVHKDIADGLKFAKIWGSGKYKGQMVERNHILADKDVIELHV